MTENAKRKVLVTCETIVLVLGAAISQSHASCELESSATGNTQFYHRYQEIESTYQRKMRVALSKDDAGKERRLITKNWLSGLDKLLSDAEKCDPGQLSAEDLSALAMAAELMQNRDDCIQFARLAIAKDAKVQLAYPPLVRTLLNKNKPEQAALVLKKASEKCEANAGIFSLHYIVYHKAASDGKNELALSQISSYVNWLLKWLSRDVDAVVQIRRHLNEYVRAHQIVDATEQLQDRLRKITEKINMAIADVQEESKPNRSKKEMESLKRLLRELEALSNDVNSISVR